MKSGKDKGRRKKQGGNKKEEREFLGGCVVLGCLEFGLFNFVCGGLPQYQMYPTQSLQLNRLQKVQMRY